MKQQSYSRKSVAIKAEGARLLQLHIARRPLTNFWLLLAAALTLVSAVDSACGRICNIKDFLEGCPASDAAYTQIRSDFVIRKDGVVVTDIPCQEPISRIPIAQYTDELIVVQALRTIYHMDEGRAGHLPWTPGTLYDWLKARIGGINITSTGGPDQLLGDAFGDGRSYFNVRAKDDYNRNLQRTWPWMGELIALMMHERRHADPTGYYHTGCCSVGGGGCDQEYNESNLSAYGIQWWLRRHWIEDGPYTGYSCLNRSDVNDIKSSFRNTDNQERDRYCQNPPPILTDANNPVAACHICWRWPRVPMLVWRWLPVWVPVIVVIIGLIAYRTYRSVQTKGTVTNR